MKGCNRNHLHKQGHNSNIYQKPLVRVDPLSRVAVMSFYTDAFAILPFNQNSTNDQNDCQDIMELDVYEKIE